MRNLLINVLILLINLITYQYNAFINILLFFLIIFFLIHNLKLIIITVSMQLKIKSSKFEIIN
jgi:hypothetical protein